jgi:2-hydroxy-3-keto-5-methylthiopentenyl-1-phosphate phosphatase
VTAISVPPLLRGDPPIALLLDYDGTVALTDVADTVMAEYVTGEWEAEAAEYDAGRMGSRRLMTREIELLHAEPEALLATAAAQPHDPTFVELVERARAARIPVEIVSDGFGFYIAPALERLGVPWIPVATSRTSFAAGRAQISYPNGHPRCFVCGTCKRERVLAHRAAGRRVVFVGDGESDRYAAGYADVVFAKRALIKICVDRGWPFRRWTELLEVDQWLVEALEAWASDGSLPAAVDRPYFCGPEVWGDGRWDPA